MEYKFLVNCLAGALLAVAAADACAEAPSGYYDSLEGLSGVSLKKAVKSVGKKGYKSVSYGSGTWKVFFESDTRMVNGQRCWWDMYTDYNVPAPDYDSHSGMNIEHSVPKSWWGGGANSKAQNCDVHHLNPSNSEANSDKSNYPLGLVSSGKDNTVGTPTASTGGSLSNGNRATRVYEPADEYKGDFARIYFYMFTIYDDISWTKTWDWMFDVSSDLLLKPWAYDLLLEWSRNDPVSQKEIDRNNAVAKSSNQGNRNPFIDCPELAEHIWGSKKNTPFHLDGSVDPDDPGNDDPGNDDPGNDDPTPDVPDTPDMPSGFWYAVTSAADLNESDRYVLVATESEVAMSCNLGSSGSFLMPSAAKPTFDRSSSPARLTDVPQDVAILTLVKSGSEWKMAVSTLSGQSKGYITSASNKKLNFTTNPADNGTNVTLTATPDKSVINFSDKVGNLEYNAAAPRFTTYTSNQEAVMLYRLESGNDSPDDPDDPGIDDPGIDDPTPDDPGNDDPDPDDPDPDDPDPDDPAIDDPTPDAGIGGTGLEENADEVIYGIFDINCRRMPRSSLSDLDSGIYIVISNFGTRKVIR